MASNPYAYVVTAQKQTNVTASCVGHFVSPSSLSLIISKSSRLEIHAVEPTGLSPVLEAPIYGRVSVLKLFKQNKDDPQDLLFILTERYQFCVLKYDTERGVLLTVAKGDVSDRIGRPTERGHIGIIDDSGKLVCMQLYEGMLKLVPIDDGFSKPAFKVRLDEVAVLDMQFLRGQARPTLVVLYQDARETRHVRTYHVHVGDEKLLDGPWRQSNVEAGATLLIPVPAPTGGVIIVGQETLTYHSGETEDFVTASMTPMFVKAYEQLDVDGSRFLLADHNGGLHCLQLTLSPAGVVQALSLQRVGTTSIAATLSYLESGFVFVGSCFGDSQLIKLSDTPVGEGEGDPAAVAAITAAGGAGGTSFIEVVESYINLGPIVDFCVMDLERQGQGQVVTCSGAHKDGSLRIVRNGIGIDEQAVIGLGGIKGIWSLGATFDAPHHKYLVQAYVGETRVFGIDGEEMEEIEIEGLDDASQSLYCGNMAGDLMLQVTPGGARLIACGSLKSVHQWAAPEGSRVTVATANATQVLLALTGGKVVYLELDPAGPSLTNVHEANMPHEVSCLSVSPLAVAAAAADGDDAGADADADAEMKEGSLTAPCKLGAIGLWTDNTVRLVELPTLTQLGSESLGGEIQARSVLLSTMEARHYLFVGLGDGHLFNYHIDPTTAELSNRKKVSLGTQPISLSTFTSKDQTHVFAACDRPTVLYSSGSKLLYSNVNLGEVTLATPFHSESFPDCLALASESDLTIGTVDDIQKLHIRTVPLGEQPRRICHHRASKSLAVCTSALISKDGARASPDEPAGDPELERGFVRLVDDSTFETMASFELDAYEMPMALASATFQDDPAEYIVVGTSFILPDEEEPSKGRLLVLAVTVVGGGAGGGGAAGGGAGAGAAAGDDDDAADAGPVERRLTLTTAKTTRGGVLSLAPFQGKLLAGINNKVQLYRWDYAAGSSSAEADLPRELVAETAYRGPILSLYLSTRGDFVLVGDLMASVTVLTYNATDGKLEELATEPNANWMTAVGILDDQNFLGAENSQNLFIAHRNAEASTDEERGRLDIVGKFHLGEFVNAFRKGSLVMQPTEVREGEGETGGDGGAGAGAGAGAGVAPAASAGAAAAPSAGAGADPAAAAAAAAAADGTAGAAAAEAAVDPSATPGSLVTPQLLYASVNGVIGVVATLKAPLFHYLRRVQRAVSKVVHGVGGFSHGTYRSWLSPQMPGQMPRDEGDDGVQGFLDGDLIETFLELPLPQMTEVVAAMNDDGEGTESNSATGPFHGPITVDAVTKVIEDVAARLH